MSFQKINLNPENKTFSEILSNGRSYTVPPFQRDYSWKKEQFDELWQDIENMIEKKIQHFMGYLVLQSKDNKKFQIIDGQQRITTLTLLIITALSRFNSLIADNPDDEESKKRRDYYHGVYLGLFNAVTLQTSLKLELNRNNKNHFKSIVGTPYNIPKKRGVNETNRLLNKTLSFFQDRLKDFKSKDLAEFISNIGDGLLFTTITVSDDLDAYLVFETLNARGVHLSASDLLKNYLLSTLSSSEEYFNEDDIEVFESIWGGIIDQLGETNFTSFLRSYEGMFSTLRHRKELYRFLKIRRINEAISVMPYVKSLEEYSSIYAALQIPSDSFWKDHHPDNYQEIASHLEVLRIFNIKTPLTLLMTAYKKFDFRQFILITKWIAIIVIRYNVICQKISKYQEDTYNIISNKINGGSLQTLDELKESIMTVYPPDDEFVSAFSIKTMPSRQSSKKIIFLLNSIEKYISGGNEMPMNLTLEHVLPYHPDDEWQEYFGRETYAEAIERLANFALLPAPVNRKIEQGNFESKKVALKNSGIQINKQIAHHACWDIDELNKQQNWLAKQAKSVWRID